MRVLASSCLFEATPIKAGRDSAAQRLGISRKSYYNNKRAVDSCVTRVNHMSSSFTPSTWAGSRSWSERSPDITLRSHALRIATAIGAAMRDERVFSQQLAVSQQLASSQQLAASPREWRAPSAAQGDIGLAICAAEFDRAFPGEGWDRVGHVYLARGAAALHLEDAASPRALSLFDGLCGVGFATWLLSRDGTRYTRLLASLDAVIASSVHAYAAALLQQCHGFGFGQYDVVYGLAGVVPYLLYRRSSSTIVRALEAAIQMLVVLTEDTDGIPHWYTPQHLIWREEWQAAYSDGLLDCGMAHGAAGFLAALALARLEGIESPGLAEAIDRLAGLLMTHRQDDAYGPNWAGVLGVDQLAASDSSGMVDASRADASLPTIPSWCYGSPGIARALWLAGSALQSQRYCDFAITAMEAVCRRDLSAAAQQSLSLCHGTAGVLQIVQRFAWDTRHTTFKETVKVLTEELVEHYTPALPFGYADLRLSGQTPAGPGLLLGSSGIALALLSAASDQMSSDQMPSWDRLFFLS